MVMMPAGESPLQQSNKKHIVFSDFDTMDTQQARTGLDTKRPAWLENLQHVAKNNLITVPGPAPALNSIAGKTIARKFFATYSGNDFIIAFTTDGAGYQIAIAGGAVTQFAPAATFSGLTDITGWASQRILIADPTSGYAQWDGHVFVQRGGVSPNIIVTNGGSGYIAPPGVTISGGSGNGATAHSVLTAGIVTSVVLDTPGTGYQAGDVLTVTFASGAATATAIVWPFLSVTPTTVAVFQGRVWLAGGRILEWSGTLGFDNFLAPNASGFQTVADADLSHQITALRSYNNYLYIFGDASVKQIGTISVSGSTTLFVITTLTSDQGTTFPLSIISYNRLVTFANFTGIWAVFGASVEKVSGPMDGIFPFVNFNQPLQSCLNDLRGVQTFMLLVSYNDPLLGLTRSIFLTLTNKKWMIISQGSAIIACTTAVIGGLKTTYVSSGADITKILASPTTAVSVLWRSALSHDGRPFQNKRSIRVAVEQSANVASAISFTSDSERNSLAGSYTAAFPITWLNNLNQVVTWQNSLAQTVTFVGGGLLFQPQQANASGVYLGASLSAVITGYALNSVVVEYIDGPDMRSRNTA